MIIADKNRALFQQSGFTLLELLVVLGIISMIIGGAMLAFSVPGSDEIKEERQRLIALTELAQEEAILLSRDIGIGFWDKGYAFYQPTGAVDDEGNIVWTPLEDKILRQRNIKAGIELQLELEGIDILMPSEPVESPQIFILSSGEISPFQLTITYDRRLQNGFSIDPLGTVELLETIEL